MHHHQPSHAFSSCWVEHEQGGYRHVGDGAAATILPTTELHRSNPSSKSSSSLSAATFAPLAAAHGGVAAVPFGMAPPGVATTTDDARFCVPWAAAHLDNNWGDSGIVVTSPLAETASTDLDDVSGGGGGGNHHALMGAAVTQNGHGHDNSLLPVCKVESRDHKAQRRLAQNREAARKSRMRKKAYIVELEKSRSKLAHLEQELQRARQQGMFIASGRSGDHGGSTGGAVAFDLEYARWLDEHQHHMADLRVALSAAPPVSDADLGALVGSAMRHYDEMFRLKGLATRRDAFHILSGMWVSPAERFFMWLGGFRSSELLRVVVATHAAGPPLTEQQLVAVCALQQSLQQAEDALSQGMEALQQALGDTLAAAGGGGCGGGGGGTDGVTNYMGQMAVAMGKLATVENFLRQADLLRQQTLGQVVHRILTARQAARALLVVSDYFSRLRALSSLWLTRPTD